MRVTTRDPMTGNDIEYVRAAPCVIEGKGENALMIYFETEENRDAYLAIPTRVPTPRSVELYRRIADHDKAIWDTVLWD